MTTQLDESQFSSQTSNEADEQDEDPTRRLMQTTRGSEAYNLLLLQEDIRVISLAQQTLEQTMESLQRREEMNGIRILVEDQDIRTLRSAFICLRSLRMRVEASVNSLEQIVIAQQLQFIMNSREQPTTSEDYFTAD